MKTTIAALGVAALVLGSAGAALAHHSGAMFDAQKELTLQGTVKEFQYTNPHSWLVVNVPDAAGKVTEWSFEAEGPSTLLRAGIEVLADAGREGDREGPPAEGRPPRRRPGQRHQVGRHGAEPASGRPAGPRRGQARRLITDWVAPFSLAGEGGRASDRMRG